MAFRYHTHFLKRFRIEFVASSRVSFTAFTPLSAIGREVLSRMIKSLILAQGGQYLGGEPRLLGLGKEKDNRQ